MGSKSSTLAKAKIEALNLESGDVQTSVEVLEATLKDISQELVSREEVITKLEKVEENQITNSGKLAQLIELNNQQQQVIDELKTKYTQLYDEYYKQQKVFIEMTGKYEDRFNRYEQSLYEARLKLHDVEKEVTLNSEFGKLMGIRKTENMIKKERCTRSGMKRSPEKEKSNHKKSKSKTREKLQNARDQRKLEKELMNASNDPDNQNTIGCESHTTFFDI